MERNEREFDDLLNAGAVVRRLCGSTLYKRVYWLGSVASTQAIARQLGESDSPHGTLVWAEYQTGGRGRRGRVWEAAKGANLIFSILLRSVLRAEDLFWVTACLSLAVCEGIEAVMGLAARIKWPNDIFLHGKKVGGILTEGRFDGSISRYIVTGLGLNVNWEPGEGKEMPYPVTSLSREAQAFIKREDLLGVILRGFERQLSFLACGQRHRIQERWMDLFMLAGKRVLVVGDEADFEGTVSGVRQDGALLVQRVDGMEVTVLAGDVSIRT